MGSAAISINALTDGCANLDTSRMPQRSGIAFLLSRHFPSSHHRYHQKTPHQLGLPNHFVHNLCVQIAIHLLDYNL